MSAQVEQAVLQQATPSAPPLTAAPFRPDSAFQVPPPKNPLGYSAQEVAAILGRSRVTAIAVIRRFHQRGGEVWDMTAHLPHPPQRARKYSPLVPPEGLRELLAQFKQAPPNLAPKRLTTSQKKRLERIEREHSSETRKRDKEKLAALRARAKGAAA